MSDQSGKRPKPETKNALWNKYNEKSAPDKT